VAFFEEGGIQVVESGKGRKKKKKKKKEKKFVTEFMLISSHFFDPSGNVNPKI
jgi:hypothetical protein